MLVYQNKVYLVHIKSCYKKNKILIIPLKNQLIGKTKRDKSVENLNIKLKKKKKINILFFFRKIRVSKVIWNIFERRVSKVKLKILNIDFI